VYCAALRSFRFSTAPTIARFQAHRAAGGSHVSLCTALIVGLTLTRVVEVWSLPAKPKDQGRKKVRRPHQRTPAFELTNVNHFVIARDVKRRTRLPEYRMSQGKCKCELPVRQVGDEPLHSAAIELNDATTDSSTPAGAQPNESECQPDQGVGRGPDDSQQSTASCISSKPSRPSNKSTTIEVRGNYRERNYCRIATQRMPISPQARLYVIYDQRMFTDSAIHSGDVGEQ
jgi:hypothetical protein